MVSLLKTPSFLHSAEVVGNVNVTDVHRMFKVHGIILPLSPTFACRGAQDGFTARCKRAICIVSFSMFCIIRYGWSRKHSFQLRIQGA